MFGPGRRIKRLESVASPIKETFAHSEKPEEERDAAYLGRNTGKKRVYADERGINGRLQRGRGRASRGVRIEGAKGGGNFRRANVAAAVARGGRLTKKA
ncbi:MAG: hypothetical protein LBD58_05880 [Treponema sp.]|jgi:hypothetical protein|nr:hypothetical protein [Treponema sp.]